MYKKCRTWSLQSHRRKENLTDLTLNPKLNENCINTQLNRLVKLGYGKSVVMFFFTCEVQILQILSHL